MQEHRWVFSPIESKSYEMRSVLHSSLEKSSVTSRIKSKAILEILGTGAVGTIKVY